MEGTYSQKDTQSVVREWEDISGRMKLRLCEEHFQMDDEREESGKMTLQDGLGTGRDGGKGGLGSLMGKNRRKL